MYVNSSAEATGRYVAWLRVRARDLIIDHPMIWALVEQLADELIKAQTISGRTLHSRLVTARQRLLEARSPTGPNTRASRSVTSR